MSLAPLFVAAGGRAACTVVVAAAAASTIAASATIAARQPRAAVRLPLPQRLADMVYMEDVLIRRQWEVL